MAINNTMKKIKETAEDNIKSKKAFEKSLISDLKKYFEQLAEDYKVIYGATGKVLTLNESYEEELSSLLKKNYRDVADKFASQSRKALDDNVDLDVFEVREEAKNNLAEKVALAVGTYILLRAKNISPKIAETTQATMKQKTDDYIINQAKAGVSVSNAQIANAVSQEIKKWGIDHASTVAMTEVQSVAEKSKNIEKAEVLTNVKNEADRIKKTGAVIIDKTKDEYTKADFQWEKDLNSFISEVDIQKGSRKTWITAGDERVRYSHEILNGRSVNENELFYTGDGSPMQYAGDMDNGARLSDVINCRCTTVYRYDTEIVKIYTNSIYKRK